MKHIRKFNENYKVHPQEMLVGQKFEITEPCYDDFDEGLEPETSKVEVIKRENGVITLKDLDHDFSYTRRFSMLTDCEIKRLEE